MSDRTRVAAECVVLGVINHKGGVGKTTSAAHIAYVAATVYNLRVLVVDCDPQGNLSNILLGNREYARHLREELPSTHHIFEEYKLLIEETKTPEMESIHDLIVEAGWSWHRSGVLDLIPSRMYLKRVADNPQSHADKATFLDRELQKVYADYDLIIIDCPPTASFFSRAVYRASDYLTVPVAPEFLATSGFPMLQQDLKIFRQNREYDKRCNTKLAGVFINSARDYQRSAENEQAISEVIELANDYGWKVFENEITFSKSVSRAAREGVPVHRATNAMTKTYDEYTKLCEELFETIGIFDPAEVEDCEVA